MNTRKAQNGNLPKPQRRQAYLDDDMGSSYTDIHLSPITGTINILRRNSEDSILINSDDGGIKKDNFADTGYSIGLRYTIGGAAIKSADKNISGYNIQFPKEFQLAQDTGKGFIR